MDSPACDEVISTRELLEAILLQLPARDILLAQRISKAFREAVERSPSIKRKLFFKPVPLSTNNENEPSLNPFLAYTAHRNERNCTIHIANGGVDLAARADEPIEDLDDTIWSQPHTISPDQSLIMFPEPLHRTGARQKLYESWRRMLVSDRPCTVEIRNTNPGPNALAFWKTITPKTLGEIADVLTQLDNEALEARNASLRQWQRKVWQQYRPNLI